MVFVLFRLIFAGIFRSIGLFRLSVAAVERLGIASMAPIKFDLGWVRSKPAQRVVPSATIWNAAYELLWLVDG